MKRLLIFATKPRVLRQAQELGFSVVNFDKPERIDDARRALVDHAEAIDWSMPHDYVGKAMRLHLERPFDAVLAFGEYTVYPAAQVREHLGLVGNPMKPVFLANEKPLFRAHLAAKAEFAVRFVRIEKRPLDVRAAADDLILRVGLPLILKPTNSSGSAGVTFCDDVHAVALRLSQHDYASPLLGEEYLDGPEISVEAFSAFGIHTVLAVTEKETTGAPRFIETGHHQPAIIAAPVEADIRRAVSAMLTLIGHDLGPSHTELRLTAKGPRIIETHTRPGGDGIADLTELTTGFDVFLETLKVVRSICDLGYDAAKTAYRQPLVQVIAYASSQFFLLPRGTLVELSGIESASAVPGVQDLAFSAKVGDDLAEPVDSHTRHGSFVVSAKTRTQVEDSIGAVRNAIHAVVR